MEGTGGREAEAAANQAAVGRSSSNFLSLRVRVYAIKFWSKCVVRNSPNPVSNDKSVNM